MTMNDTWGFKSDDHRWKSTQTLLFNLIHLFEWPQGSFTLDQVDVNLKKAYLLADPAKKPLPSTYQDNRLSITLPEKAPDAIASVLVLEIEGEATQKP
jgi:hypothetical protein